MQISRELVLAVLVGCSGCGGIEGEDLELERGRPTALGSAPEKHPSRRCEPPCGPDEHCVAGRCVVPDARTHGPPADGAAPDRREPPGRDDAGAADAGVPDGAPGDASPPDVLQADLPSPDLSAPDLFVPDMPVPDTLASDLSAADISFPDVLPDAATPDLLPGCVHPPVVESCTNGWCAIPAGCFLMGSPVAEPCRDDREDRHVVTLTHDFEIQATPVTQAQYAAKIAPAKPGGPQHPAGPSDPSYFTSCGGDCPVEQVDWYQAVAYCNELSEDAGLTPCYTCSGSAAAGDFSCEVVAAFSGADIYSCPGYRLPTEAEFEYAIRAGTQTAYHNGPNDPSVCSACALDTGLDAIGWYCANSAVTYAGCVDLSAAGGPTCAGPTAVGQRPANAWGLHDLAGNVWEWGHDWHQDHLGSAPVTDPAGPPSRTGHVVRGGCWKCMPGSNRSASRSRNLPDRKNPTGGFRCIRTLNP